MEKNFAKPGKKPKTGDDRSVAKTKTLEPRLGWAGSKKSKQPCTDTGRSPWEKKKKAQKGDSMGKPTGGHEHAQMF